MIVLNKLLGVIVMFLLCASIPFVWWKIRYKRQRVFFAWLGFIKPQLKKSVLFLVIYLIMYVLFDRFDFTSLFDKASLDNMNNSSNVAKNAYKGLGVIAILPAFIEAFLINGLGEELFFRGFLTKRFVSRLGTTKGILLQAILFGLMHNILFTLSGLDISIKTHVVILCYTGSAGFLLGFLNEKIFNGSILPSIFLHGLGNFIVMMISAF